MSQNSAVQATAVKVSASPRTADGLLMSSLSPRQATRQPGSRPTAKPDDSDRKQGSLISNDARRESRRNTRQMVATASASQAETFA